MATGIGGEVMWLCPSLDSSPYTADLSGNSNSGTLNGGMGTVADTGSGGSRAYYMDNRTTNQDHRVIVSSATALDILTSNDWSCSCWVKIESAYAYSGYMQRWVANHKNLLLRDNGSGVPQVYTGSGNTTGVSATATTDISGGAWYHLAVTWTASDKKLRIYVDGTLEGTSAAGSATSPTTDLLIGGKLNDSGKQFDGWMDDIRIWDSLITTQNITDLASSRGYEPVTFVPTPRSTITSGIQDLTGGI